MLKLPPYQPSNYILGSEKLPSIQEANTSQLENLKPLNQKTKQKFMLYQRDKNDQQKTEKHNEIVDTLVKENEKLREIIQRLQSENIVLVEEKQYIKTQFLNFLGEISKNQDLQHASFAANNFAQNIQSLLKNPLIPQSNNHLQLLNQNLNHQIDLLTKIKDKLVLKLEQEKQKARILYRQIQMWEKQRQKYEAKLQKEMLYNKECERQMMKLSSELKETRRQIQRAMQDERRRESQTEKIQIKLQRQIQKWKEKCEKYKQKSQQYREQRDILLTEIQQEQVETGKIAHRKYFPLQAEP